MREYNPLAIWIVIILFMTYIISHIYYGYSRWSMMDMNILMSVRFLIFGGIKLFDIEWFATMFSEYDPIAKIFNWYAYIFPFLEIVLWIIYIYDINMIYWFPTNLAAAIISGITSIGIAIALYQEKKNLKCVCMWSKFCTPLWVASFLEQFVMCVMAIYMIYMMMSMGM